MIEVVCTDDGRFIVPLARPYEGMGVTLESGVLGYVAVGDDAMSLIFQANPDVTITDRPYEPGRNHNRRKVVGDLLALLWRLGYVDADTVQVPFELIAGPRV